MTKLDLFEDTVRVPANDGDDGDSSGAS